MKSIQILERFKNDESLGDFFLLEKLNIGVGGEHGEPPNEVYMYIDEIGGEPLGIKLTYFFDKPEALKKVIEDLIGYYNLLWADAEPIDPNADVSQIGVVIDNSEESNEK